MSDTAPQSHHKSKIFILMCTFQGEKYLAEQLESIRQQRYRNWQLFVSDDGSTDQTLAILRHFQASLAPGQMQIFNGPRKGFSNNFMQLLLNPSIAGGDYYAFSDQDDFWCDDKLTVAIAKLESLSGQTQKPAVYASARTLVDSQLKPIGEEGTHRLMPSFKNALAQNIAGGNTIVLNEHMRTILLNLGVTEVVSHDWWVYLMCTGVGGIFYYDEKAHVLYRQHSNNAIGSNSSWRMRLNRLQQFFSGRYRRWMDLNLKALERSKWALTSDHAITMEKLALLRKKSALARVVELFLSGIHRQSRLGTAGLLLACQLRMV